MQGISVETTAEAQWHTEAPWVLMLGVFGAAPMKADLVFAAAALHPASDGGTCS